MIRPTLLLLVAGLGIAAAFFRPAEPHQVPAETPPATAFGRDLAGGDFIEHDDLDNPDVPEDPSLQAARKCGFCIGVSCSCRDPQLLLQYCASV